MRNEMTWNSRRGRVETCSVDRMKLRKWRISKSKKVTTLSFIDTTSPAQRFKLVVLIVIWRIQQYLVVVLIVLAKLSGRLCLWLNNDNKNYINAAVLRREWKFHARNDTIQSLPLFLAEFGFLTVDCQPHT